MSLADEITLMFAKAGFEQPAFEARQLLQAAGSDSSVVRQWAAERVRGVPLAYLTRKKGFYKFEFAVEPGVLVPRPETEHVVEVALRSAPAARTICDLGSGSGCIGLSILHELPHARLWAVDQSSLACAVTTRNAEKLDVGGRLTIVQASVPEWQPQLVFDLIVANPPYIAEGDSAVQPSVHEHEPHTALYSGRDGLDAIRRWGEWSAKHLAKGGVFVCEIGAGQMQKVREIMSEWFIDIEVQKDLAGIDRVIKGRRHG